MRRSAVWHEAWQNLVSGTARFGTLACVSLLIVVGLLGAELATVRGQDQLARDFQTHGASIIVVSGQKQIDGALCDSLRSQPGVRAAGAARKMPKTAYFAQPKTSLPVYQVTPDFPRLFRPDEANVPGVTLSTDAAGVVGAKPGDTFATTTGVTSVAGVYEYPDDGRMQGFGYAMLEPVLPEGSFDMCLVDAWPPSKELQKLVRGVKAPDADEREPIKVSQLNTRLGEGLTNGFGERLSRWALPIAVVAVGFLAMVAVRARRLECATALHLGVRKIDVLRIALGEAFLWLLPSALVSLAVAAVYAVTGVRVDAWENFAFAMLIPLATTASGLLGTAVSVLSVKESELFTYFKGR